MAATVPDAVRGFNWGGFLLSWIWAIGNNVWVGLLALVPVLGLVINLWLGFNGTEMAWRSKRWASAESFRNAQRSWAQLGIASLVLGVLSATLVFPVFDRARENTRRARCQSNLKLISLAIYQFSQDHDERFPDSQVPEVWKDELATYAGSASNRIWICPSNEDEPIGYELNSRVAGISMLRVPHTADLPILWDKHPDHLGGRNIAFADGHIRWFTENKYQAEIKPEADNFFPTLP